MINRMTSALGVALLFGSPLAAMDCDWEPLGTGVAPAAYACAVLDNGNAVFGGSMSLAGSIGVEHIAIWTGADWESVGLGVNGFVRALLAEPGGGFVAGGHFTEAGGTAAGLIARWNGAQWQALGQGLDAGSCRCLLRTSDGDLIAAGSFLQADKQPAWGIARWDGRAWTKLGNNTDGGGFAGTFTSGGSPTMVLDLEVLPNGDLIACGNFTEADGVSAAGIARWDGTQWSPLGSGVNWVPRAMTLLPDGALLVAGLFGQAGGVDCNGLAVWDGSTWAAFGDGLNGLASSSPFALITTDQGRVVMSGTFDMVDSVPVNNIAIYDQSSDQWAALGSGMVLSFQTSVFAVSADREGKVFAGGQFASAAGNPDARNAAVFDCNSCPADLDASGSVDLGDLLIVLSGWGTPSGDLTGDGQTDIVDLIALLSAWGPC